MIFENDPNMKVYATRITEIYPDFPERTDLANHLANIFVSMHCNSGSKQISGIQMFYPNPTDNRGNTSKQLADIIGANATLHSGISKMGADQTIGYELWVLRKTTIPACLIEIGFLTNTSDASKLSDANNRQLMSQGIYEGIKKSFSGTIRER